VSRSKQASRLLPRRGRKVSFYLFQIGVEAWAIPIYGPSLLKKPFPPPHDILVELLIDARKSAKLTQVDLAAKLSLGQSAVSKVERGMQRIDLVELHRWLVAIGGPTLADVASAFEERVEARIAAAARWKKARRAKKAAPVPKGEK